MKPKDFENMNATSVKRKYRDLSRKFHPDKNEEDTTEIFMKI